MSLAKEFKELEEGKFYLSVTKVNREYTDIKIFPIKIIAGTIKVLMWTGSSWFEFDNTQSIAEQEAASYLPVDEKTLKEYSHGSAKYVTLANSLQKNDIKTMTALPGGGKRRTKGRSNRRRSKRRR